MVRGLASITREAEVGFLQPEEENDKQGCNCNFQLTCREGGF